MKVARLPVIHAGRIFDVLALAVILFAAYKLVVAPRYLEAPGQRAMALALPAMDGGTFALGARKGRVVYLDFWASWCEPCRLSLPLVERFARSHPEVDVMAVDVGEPPVVASEYARAHKLAGVVFDRDGLAASGLGVVVFPTIVVVARRGFVRAKWTGFNPAIELAMAHAEEGLATSP